METGASMVKVGRHDWINAVFLTSLAVSRFPFCLFRPKMT